MNAETLPVKKNTILSLQAIRAITCLTIFIYHATHRSTDYTLPLGRWGVSVFFVLSGFVMALSYWERPAPATAREAAAFSLKKIKPLFVLHVVMLLFGLLQKILTSDTPWQTYAVQLLLTVPLLQTWSPTNYQALNSVDWYLSVTMFLYLAFPFILAFLRKWRPDRRQSLLLMAAVWLVQLILGALVGKFLPDYTKWLTYCFPVYRLGDFLIGCILGSLFRRRDAASGGDKAPRASGTVTELLIVLAIAASWVLNLTWLKEHDWFTYTCLYVPTSACLIYFFAKEEGRISRAITNRATLYFAGLSAAFFLIHRQVLYFTALGLDACFSETVNRWVVGLLAFPITLLAVTIYMALRKKRSANPGKAGNRG